MATQNNLCLSYANIVFYNKIALVILIDKTICSSWIILQTLCLNDMGVFFLVCSSRICGVKYTHSGKWIPSISKQSSCMCVCGALTSKFIWANDLSGVDAKQKRQETDWEQSWKETEKRSEIESKIRSPSDHRLNFTFAMRTMLVYWQKTAAINCESNTITHWIGYY